MRSSDVFFHLFKDQPDQLLPSELKQAIFNGYLTLRERVDLSLINKGSRDFYLRTILSAIIKDLEGALTYYGLMQTNGNRLTTQNFWDDWQVSKDNQVTGEMMRAAVTLAEYLDEDYPTVWDRDGFIEWLAQPHIQAIMNVKFWQIALYKILLNMGIEIEEAERSIAIVTQTNLATVKAFVLGQHRCQKMHSPSDEFMGLRAVINAGGAFDYEKETRAIIDLQNSFEQLGCVRLAEHFKQRMLVSYLKDNSNEFATASEKVIQEYHVCVDNLTGIFKKHASEINGLLKINSYLYLYDKRSAKAVYGGMSLMKEDDLLQFIGRYNSCKDQLDLDRFLLLNKVSSQIAYVGRKEYFGDFAATLFDAEHGRIDFILKIIFMHGAYLAFTEKSLYQAFKETFNLYLKHAQGAYVNASLLQQIWFYFNVEGPACSYAKQNASKFFAMLKEVEQDHESYIRLTLQLALLNPVTAIDFINNVPKAYEINPELVKRAGFDTELICFDLSDDNDVIVIGSGLTLFERSPSFDALIAEPSDVKNQKTL